MGPKSHATGYLGCSTERLFFKPNEIKWIPLSPVIAIRYVYHGLLIPSPAVLNSTTPHIPKLQLVRTHPYLIVLWQTNHFAFHRSTSVA
jgi:hypothetical protein